ncbi:MAG TPA: hypothetical protein VMD09_13190 [Solirubrobacteraceae bacterium]|nr:hypothetical protein [Solirubrobacteraceae bacterium]
MEIPADGELRLAVFTAEPGSRSAEALDLLGSWAATEHPAERADPERAPADAQARQVANCW